MSLTVHALPSSQGDLGVHEGEEEPAALEPDELDEPPDEAPDEPDELDEPDEPDEVPDEPDDEPVELGE